MKCKDCANYKYEGNIEAGTELAPNVKSMKGKCNISNKVCGAMDNCGCEGFSEK